MIILPAFYQTHLESQLGRSQYLMLTILVNLVQSIKQVRLEALATAFPYPIKFDSRRRRIQRFLLIPQMTVETIWLPIIKNWLETDFLTSKIIYIAIDRTGWGKINLLMISLIWDKRAIPLYFEILPKLGSSNFGEQTTALFKVLRIFAEYKIVILGDREFGSVKLGNWLKGKKVYFCLRLRRTEFVQVKDEVWVQLNDLGLAPGVAFYLQGVKVTKHKNLAGFNVTCKWQRKFSGWAPDEGWFILTNLESLTTAITAYKRRFGIEEMFRDFKSGGYNLESTNVANDRLISLIILIAIAYISSTIQGRKIKRTGVQEYVGRVKEFGRSERRHSSFYIGLYGQAWVNFMAQCTVAVSELMRLASNKRKYFSEV